MRTAVSVLIVVLLGCGANAQSKLDYSANAALPGCVDAAQASNGGTSFAAGYCLGMVRSLSTVSGAFKACLPTGVTGGQTVRVVVAFINRHPARMHEPFEGLAIEAIREAWPCR